MRVIFYISALKDEVKVQEKKTQLELPSRQGKNPLPTQRRTQRSYSSRALGSRPPHASHSRAAPHRFTPFPSPERSRLSPSPRLPCVAAHRSTPSPSPAIRSGGGSGGNRRVLFKRVLPSEYPIVPLRPFDGFPIVRGCVCWRGLD